MAVSIVDLSLAHFMLYRCVHKSAQFGRLFYKKGFGVAASFLILVAPSIHAGEPVFTLALIQPPEISFTKLPADFTSHATDSLFDLNKSQYEATSLKNEEAAALSANNWLEEQTNRDFLASFPLLPKNLHPIKSISLHYGYERFWDDDSMFRKISPDNQEVGMVFISTNFSF